MTPRRPSAIRRAPARTLTAGLGTTGLLGLAALVVLPACGSDPSRAERYCSDVQANLAALVTPAIATEADIAATLDLYRSLADQAPIAVQPEWERLVQSLETAATVNPADPASVQLAADTARITESAAVRIQQYTNQICGVAIGDVPPATDIVTATTLAPPDTGSVPADDGA